MFSSNATTHSFVVGINNRQSVTHYRDLAFLFDDRFDTWYAAKSSDESARIAVVLPRETYIHHIRLRPVRA